MTRYIAIGDVHGQHRLLHQAIQELDDGDTFFILLGDLNDSRLKGPAQTKASSLECIRIAMSLMSRGAGVTLQSNHGAYLYRALLGGEILPYRIGDAWATPSRSTMGLSHTLQEMNLMPQESQQRVGRWLQGLPYYWTVTTDGNSVGHPTYPTSTHKTWYAVHGMWVPGMSQWRPNHEHVQASVYGKGLLGKRAKFWEDQEYIQALPPNTYTISGHYHKVVMEPPCYVIDSNCGSGGSLMGVCLNDLTEYHWGEPYP